MFRMEHINMTVTDHEASLAFYQLAFPQWSVREQGKAHWGSRPYDWIHFGTDTNYITLNQFEDGLAISRQGAGNVNHIGFETQDIAGLIARMKGAGHQPSLAGPEHQYRQNIYFADPDGFEIEFVEYMSDDPNLRNL
ncbi:VOC family protein [Glaciecola sp. XM2]|uniref:VOC family protein n=1 Tax=Glaciecola sp. XM2 TaxID=1914931 RepID=UPI001BDEFF68|nr:VOC family protein [Glaciecola sp. XM2]MBT1451293.1 VOC family protein [Glaciecola sp. XM2]